MRDRALACDAVDPASELLLRAFNHLPEQVAILDGTGRILFANCAPQSGSAWATDLADRLLHPVRASTVAGLNGADAPGSLGALFSRARRRVTLNYSVRHASGLRWFKLTAVNLAAGREQRIMLVNKETTRAKQSELLAARLASLNVRLQEGERRLISQELHDSTSQHLASISLNLMCLRAQLRHRDDGATAIIDEIERAAEAAMKELRTFTYLLSPADLQSDGLERTLYRYVEGFSRRSGLCVDVEVDPATNALAPAVQKSVVRVVQEALANAHRHAAASRVCVRCRMRDRALHILVFDNGRGFNSGEDRLPNLGVGLPGMRMRVAGLGGTFSIRTGCWGTVIRARIPARPSRLNHRNGVAREDAVAPRAREKRKSPARARA